MSQRELARRTNSHPDVISRFAREATSGVSYDLLDRICGVLDCSPADLLKFEPEQPTLFQHEGLAGATAVRPTNGSISPRPQAGIWSPGDQRAGSDQVRRERSK